MTTWPAIAQVAIRLPDPKARARRDFADVSDPKGLMLWIKTYEIPIFWGETSIDLTSYLWVQQGRVLNGFDMF